MLVELPLPRLMLVACSSCGSENPPGSRFCGGCGALLSQACPACGGSNDPGMRFCNHCGGGLLVEAPVAVVSGPASADEDVAVAPETAAASVVDCFHACPS